MTTGRFALLLALSASGAAFAADSDFNGRWDIRVINEPRGRAFWLEVTGAGTPNLKGRFVGFPGGQMEDIQKPALRNGLLSFSFYRPVPPGKKGQPVNVAVTARYVNGKLEGDYKQAKIEFKWIGERAPEIADKDDDSWKKGKPVHLFNGKDLSGWRGTIPGRELGWRVENGILKNVANANNIVHDQKFWNFLLHVEFKVGPKSNSGIGLRSRYEVQIMEDHGRPVDGHSMGSIYSRIVPSENASKPAGEWQTYDIRLVGRQVTVVLNGKKVVQGVIEGLTAVATDPDEGKPGPISLQGDHGEVEFRSIVLTPLVK
jgi:hypothetical protein